jgi:hypothetical protein
MKCGFINLAFNVYDFRFSIMETIGAGVLDPFPPLYSRISPEISREGGMAI